MPWGALVGGALGLVGASMQSSAASDAANAQTQASQNSIAEQEREFNLIQQMLGPQRNLGYGAMGQLAGLFGLPNPNATSTNSLFPANPSNSIGPQSGGAFGSPLMQGGFGPQAAAVAGGGGAPGGGFGILHSPALKGAGGTGILSGSPTPASPSTNGGPNYSSFFNTPGFGFTLNTGLQAINRNASANGGLYTPNTMNALGNYAEGVASTQYNNYVNQLLQMAGLGGAAVSGTAGAAQGVGNNISSNLLSAGNANASGILGSSNAWGSAIKQIGGSITAGNFNGLFSGGGGGGAGWLGAGTGGTPGAGDPSAYDGGFS